jgi:DNA-binding transcriptional LysR family regulator
MEPANINDIVAFVAAVEVGSFVGAARVRGMSRSGIAKSVARLESRLGVRLFNRTTRSLGLTDDGQLFHDRCVQILTDLEDAELSLTQGGGEPQGLLRLTAPATFGRVRILPIINEYLAAWPRLRVEASFSDRVSDIIEEGYDLAIRIGSGGDCTRLISRTLARHQSVVVASPAYLATRHAPKHPDDLAQHDCLNFASGGRRFAWHFRIDKAPLSVRSRARLTLDSGEALREAALSGAGITCLPSYLVDDDIAAGRLCSLLGNHSAAPEPIIALYPSRRHLAPKVRRFIDLLAIRLA